MSTVTALGALSHDVPTGSRADKAVFDREGYAVARQVIEPELLRRVRAPLIDKLLSEGWIEPLPADEDRFLWIGDAARFNRKGWGALIVENIEHLLLRSGVASTAVETAWGRKPAIGPRLDLYIMVPRDPVRVHRDGWQMMYSGGSEEHFNFWAPLTKLDSGDGPLAVAVGSHLIPNDPPLPPTRHAKHLDARLNGRPPAGGVLEPLWRATHFELGDAILFRPDIVHSTTPNDGPYLRIAFAMRGWDNTLPYDGDRPLSLDAGRALAEVEWLTLATLAVQPSTPWLVSQAFYPRGVIGRLWECQRLETIDKTFTPLEARGLIEPTEPHDDSQGAIHRNFRVTPHGRAAAAKWTTTPSAPGDERLLSVKLLLCDWLELEPAALIAPSPHPKVDQRPPQR